MGIWIPFEYRKHLNTNFVKVWISNGGVFKWSELSYVLYYTDHSNTGPLHKSTRWCSFVQYIWSKVVRSPNGPVLECHLNTELSLFRFSEHHLNPWPVCKWWSEYRTSEFQTVKVCCSDVYYSDSHFILIELLRARVSKF